MMNLAEKRDLIHSHLHKVKEPIIDDIYIKMMSLINDSFIEESEEDISNGNLISHDELKKEIFNWRPTK